MRDGDTLATIAQSLWGDSSLWYMLADANGMDGTETLVAGRDLIVPNKVANLHNTSSTYRVYDPNEAIGNNSPTATAPNPVTPHPTAQHKHNCGVFGAILVAVIAVAVTVVTAGAAAAALSPAISTVGGGISALAAGTAGLGVTVAAGAIGGAVGSAVSQAFGVVTGIQEKFNWSGVALSALSGAVSGGIGKAGLLAKAGAFEQGAVDGVLGNAATQGLGVLTGLQTNFDWAGVAAAGIGGGTGAALGRSLHLNPLSDRSFGNIAGNLTAGTAGALANAATRSIVSGTDFGDNILAALPDVIGSTIGNLVAQGIAQPHSAALAAATSVDEVLAAIHSGQLDEQGTIDANDLKNLAIEVASNPGDKAARATLSSALGSFVDTYGDPTAVADYHNLVDPAAATAGASTSDIVVEGHRGYYFGRTIDTAGIWTGEQADRLQRNVSGFIAEHPGVGIALSIANVGLTVAGGPVRYLAGMALDHVKNQASAWLSDQMQDADWSVAKADAGGKGFVLAGEILLGGASALSVGIAGVGRAAEGSLGADVIAGRQATARSFYESAGWSDARISNHMAGIDFNHPVDVISLSENDTLVQHMVPGSSVGNYFAPVGTPASELGINPAGRVPTLFSPTTEVPVLRSTAAPIVDTWTVPEAPFNASGGGTQYFTQAPGHFRRIP